MTKRYNACIAAVILIIMLSDAVRTAGLAELCHGNLLDVCYVMYLLYYNQADKSREKRFFQGNNRWLLKDKLGFEGINLNSS